MRLYLDTNYPKNLTEALRLIHETQQPAEYEIIRTQSFDESDVHQTVVFLFDKSKKGIDVVTQKHFEFGYRVFALKITSKERFDFFELSLTIIRMWPKILDTIKSEKNPFVFTYNYKGTSLKKARGE